jgi:hypothetical protein
MTFAITLQSSCSVHAHEAPFHLPRLNHHRVEETLWPHLGSGQSVKVEETQRPLDQFKSLPTAFGPETPRIDPLLTLRALCLPSHRVAICVLLLSSRRGTG